MQITPSFIFSVILFLTTAFLLFRVILLFQRDLKKSKLRNNGFEVTACVVSKKFSKDAGFGDCDQVLMYSFETLDKMRVIGQVHGPESSFNQLKERDLFLVRYLKAKPLINLPVDMLEIVKAREAKGSLIPEQESRVK